VNKYEFKITEQFDSEGFSETANNRILSFEGEFCEEVSWEVPLKSFVDFLSSWYGYDIADHIHTESIMDSHVFKHIPKDDKFSRRVRKAMENLEDDE
jgi:hypothetical protein